MDPLRPITVRELCHSRCIHGAGDGVKLLANNYNNLKQPIHVVVSRASAKAIAAVEAAGGSVTTRFYTRKTITRVVKNETHPFVSVAWTAASGSEALHKAAGLPADLTEASILKKMGFRYRLSDPTHRRDIEYYRDPAHRGYLSHLLDRLEGPSLFFRSPELRKSTASVKKEKKLPENRLW